MAPGMTSGARQGGCVAIATRMLWGFRGIKASDARFPPSVQVDDMVVTRLDSDFKKPSLAIALLEPGQRLPRNLPANWMLPNSVPTSIQAPSGGVWQEDVLLRHLETVWKLWCKGKPSPQRGDGAREGDDLPAAK